MDNGAVGSEGARPKAECGDEEDEYTNQATTPKKANTLPATRRPRLERIDICFTFPFTERTRVRLSDNIILAGGWCKEPTFCSFSALISCEGDL